MKKLMRIGNRKNMERVYEILKRNSFPHLPDNRDEAISRLLDIDVYCYLYKDEYVFIYIEEYGKMYLDVCVPEVDGKKMTRDFIYHMLDVGFNKFECDKIYIHPTTQKAIIMESKRFKPVGEGIYIIESDDIYYGKAAIKKYFRRKIGGVL